MAKLPVREFRKLTLPIETAVDVVLELDSEQGGSLSHGTLVEAQIETEPEPGLVVVARRRGSDASERRKFTLPVIAAALIRYCWKCRIPLPRAGSKRIEIIPEGFAFTIENTVEVVRRHGALPQGRLSVEPSAGAPGESPATAAPAAAATDEEPSTNAPNGEAREAPAEAEPRETATAAQPA